MGVHRPIRNLLRRLVLNPQPRSKSNPPSPTKGITDSTPIPPPPDSEFVTLLETLAHKLVKDSSLIGFFVDELHFEVCGHRTNRALLSYNFYSGGRIADFPRFTEAPVGSRFCWRAGSSWGSHLSTLAPSIIKYSSFSSTNFHYPR